MSDLPAIRDAMLDTLANAGADGDRLDQDSRRRLRALADLAEDSDDDVSDDGLLPEGEDHGTRDRVRGYLDAIVRRRMAGPKTLLRPLANGWHRTKELGKPETSKSPSLPDVPTVEPVALHPRERAQARQLAMKQPVRTLNELRQLRQDDLPQTLPRGVLRRRAMGGANRIPVVEPVPELNPPTPDFHDTKDLGKPDATLPAEQVPGALPSKPLKAIRQPRVVESVKPTVNHSQPLLPHPSPLRRTDVAPSEDSASQQATNRPMSQISHLASLPNKPLSKKDDSGLALSLFSRPADKGDGEAMQGQATVNNPFPRGSPLEQAWLQVQGLITQAKAGQIPHRGDQLWAKYIFPIVAELDTKQQQELMESLGMVGGGDVNRLVPAYAIKQQLESMQDEAGRDASSSSHSINVPEKELIDAPVKERKQLGGGCNTTDKVILGNGITGVWKPAHGEEPGLRESIKPGTYWRREALASSLANRLGLDDIVPTTVGRKVDGKDGALMTWAHGAKVAQMYSPDQAYDGDKDLARAAAFDYLIGNTDRHEGNWMLKETPDGKKLVLIDHGLSFPRQHKSEGFANADIIKRAIKKNLRIPEEVGKWRDKRQDVIDALKASGLSQVERALTLKRFDHLVNHATNKGKFDRAMGLGDADVLELPRKPLTKRERTVKDQ